MSSDLHCPQSVLYHAIMKIWPLLHSEEGF